MMSTRYIARGMGSPSSPMHIDAASASDAGRRWAEEHGRADAGPVDVEVFCCEGWSAVYRYYPAQCVKWLSGPDAAVTEQVLASEESAESARRTE